MALDGDVSGANRRLSAIRRGLQSEIARLLKRLSTEDGVVIRDSLGNYERIRSQVLEALRTDGAPLVLTVGEQASMAAVQSALKGAFPGKASKDDPVAISTRAEAEATLRASTAAVLDDIPIVWEAAADEVRQAIDRGLAGLPLDELIAEVSERLDVSTTRSGVLVEAAIRAAYQRATLIAAENAAQGTGEPMAYLYDGPEDRKTRPFCQSVIGRAYTLEAIKRLDNGQGLSVEVHRGGYNCRHRWSPISIEDAKAEGYKIIGALGPSSSALVDA